MSVKTRRAPTSKLALLAFLVLLAYGCTVNFALTQWLAAKFGHQPALGSASAFGFYPPFAWLKWLWRYYRSAPETFAVAYTAFGVAMLVGGLAYALFVGFWTRGIKKHEGVHGTAHWASEDEIRASGLLAQPGKPGAGVYCGAWRDAKDRLHYLRHNGPEHVAAIAPTRSGKGVGLVVPTLLSWPHSVVVNDQKGELWAMTAGWRQAQAGNLVLKFDPASSQGSVAFNPLEEVRVGTEHEVGDVQNLVTIIVDPDGKGMTDHWSKTAHALLTGLILHLQYEAREAGSTAALPDVAAALSDPLRPVTELYNEMLENRHIVDRDAAGREIGRRIHPTVASAARDMLNRADAERSSVLSTAMSYLSLYRDPLVARNVSRSDFKIADLMNHVRVTEETNPETGEVTERRTPVPVSLYLVVRAEDKDRMRPLMRLILNQIIRVLLRPELKYVDGRELPPHLTRLLMMVDEFPSYGRLDVFQEALAYIAGYQIKAYLIMQDVSQLQAIYGRDESILSNCHIRIAYAPNKIETGEWLSKSSGVTTVITERITTSGARFGAFLQQTSRSFSEGSRPLITADEAMRLKSPTKDAAGNIEDAGEVLVFAAGHAPIKGEQSLYFLNPVFSQRVKIPAPQKSDQVSAAVAGASCAGASTGEFRAVLTERQAAEPPPATPASDAASTAQPSAPAGPPSTHKVGRTRRAQTHRALEDAYGEPQLDFGRDSTEARSDEATDEDTSADAVASA